MAIRNMARTADMQVEICQANRSSRFADIQHQSQKPGQFIAALEDIGCARIAIPKLAHIQTKKNLSHPDGKWQRSAKKCQQYQGN